MRNGPSDDDSLGLLREAEARARLRLGGGPPSALPGIGAWRATMSAFGCKPSRYPCSAEALLKRVARGDELPAINRLVDLYNAISVTHALPLGGEDVERVRGVVVLMPAVGDEEFDGGDPPSPGRDRLARRPRGDVPRLELAPGSAHPYHRGVDPRLLPARGHRAGGRARPRSGCGGTLRATRCRSRRRDRAAVGPRRRRDAGPAARLLRGRVQPAGVCAGHGE